ARPVHDRALPARRDGDARFARSRDDIRPLPLLRAARGDRADPRIGLVMALAGLTRLTNEDAPTVCQSCVWWQSRVGRSVGKERWMEKTEDEWGPWGTLYLDDDGRLLGSMQYGPVELFPR